MAMKNLKQTTLSFAPTQKKTGGSASHSTQALASSSLSSSSSKALRQTRGVELDFVAIPPPPKRTVRMPLPLKATSAQSSRAKAKETQPRKGSLKRRLSPEPRTESPVYVPRITVDAASSPIARNPRESSIKTGPPAKKLRLSSPLSDLTPLASSTGAGSVHESDADETEFVPTSQSNEEELSFPGIGERSVELQENVARWRRGTLPEDPEPSSYGDRSCSPLSDVPLDIDYNPFVKSNDLPDCPEGEGRSGPDGLQYPQTPCSLDGDTLPKVASSVTLVNSTQPEPSCHKEVGPETSPSDAFRSLTPPPSSDTDDGMEPEQPEAPVVQPLDIKSKTEQLIADIRARAFAAAQSSPEPTPLDIGDLSDDDSSDDDMPGGIVATLTMKSKSRDATKAPETSSMTGPSNATPRYNLRRNSPPKTQDKWATPATATRKPRKANPLEALIREKRREELNGTGMAAVRKAEETIARAKAGLHDEMEHEEHGSDSDSDEEHGLVRKGRKQGRGAGNESCAGPSRTHKAKRIGNTSDDEDETIDCVAILGKKDGKAVRKILADDVKEEMAEALAKLNERPLGAPFWSTVNGGNAMDVESRLPAFTAEVCGSSARQLLKAAASQNDVGQVIALLTSGFMTFLGTEQYSVVLPWLFETAFSDADAYLGTLAYTQLMWLGSVIGAHSSGLLLSSVVSALKRIGASHDVIERHGWTSVANITMSPKASDSHWRAEMVYRLVSLVNTFAQSFAREELSDLLLAMTLVGFDPTTSENLQTEVRTTCDSLAAAMTPSQEFAACTKAVAFAKTLSPANQAHFLSFFPCVSRQSLRMARCVARSLLLDEMPTPTEYEQELPSLAPFIDLLAPAPGSGGYFDIQGNSNREGFYDELTCRLSLLSRVLSDVDEYTIVEKREADERKESERARRDTTAKGDSNEGEIEKKADEDAKEKEPREPKLTVLEQIKRQLDLLHGKIVDTRAAHLDRSRAKAALQRLSFRVYYQREATLKSGVGSKRPRNLLGYFVGHS